ncbi:MULTISPECIES: hypothetical protein [unclassified Paenibacillus]|uniref:hypothetical protein n=2 Tax=Paenibacillus TaxID=44249 RepID=UPI0009A7EE41|nr:MULTISPECIES: hypothetical protein [unclassified Paenibacillus]SLJ87746.1 hypothetical protein SAMN06272722_1014 [Paenibacillus sp. RU5A]SOC65664.1 hypothetical protein SAMN05880581_1011187 [Paenibacillus sp. RU26A]SOC68689.1 hypothetical protein SAMN05880586_1011186 [Paenibacillus sp. RU5M]
MLTILFVLPLQTNKCRLDKWLGAVGRYMNAGHEIGHILGLNHFENAPAHSGDHWMKSGNVVRTDKIEANHAIFTNADDAESQ